MFEIMSVNDYLVFLRKRNPKAMKANKLIITPKEFEKHIQLAFEAGAESGKTEKSLFETIFGK